MLLAAKIDGNEIVERIAIEGSFASMIYSDDFSPFKRIVTVSPFKNCMMRDNKAFGPDRGRFIREAMDQGIAIHRIEAYLDWRDLVEQADTVAEREALLRQSFEFRINGELPECPG